MENETQDTARMEFEERLVQFAKTMAQTIGLRLEYKAKTVENMLFLDFSGQDVDDLTTNRCELLFAVEYLLNKIFQTDVDRFGMINCDVAGKKQSRMAELKLIAQVAADKVRETRLPYRLSPMDSRERRLIHLALAHDQTIRTESEGEGEFRKVVIYPAP